jgi:hypothetical protein
MSPASKTDFELDTLIKEYENRKGISEPERNRKLVVLRSTKEALADSESMPEAFAAMVIYFIARDDEQKPRNSISVSWKDGIKASGPWAVAAACMLLLAGMFVYSHTENSKRMQAMSEQIQSIQKMVK